MGLGKTSLSNWRSSWPVPQFSLLGQRGRCQADSSQTLYCHSSSVLSGLLSSGSSFIRTLKDLYRVSFWTCLFSSKARPAHSYIFASKQEAKCQTRSAACTASPLVWAALGKFIFWCPLLLGQPLTTIARELQKSPMHHWLKLSRSSMLRDARHAPPKHAGRCEDQDYYQRVIWPSHLPKEMRYTLWQSWWKGNKMCATQQGKLLSDAPQKHIFLPTFPLAKVTCTETVPDIAPASSFILAFEVNKACI